MKGIPSKNNFIVLIVSTNESKEYKTLSEIAKEYGLNYYTAREINRITESKTDKRFPHSKLASIFDKIKIYRIKDDINF
jgi:hypothetical protein